MPKKMDYEAVDKIAIAELNSLSAEILEVLELAADGCSHSHGMRYCTPCLYRIQLMIDKLRVVAS